MPTAEQLGISDQSWLAGIGDSVSELGKILNRRLRSPKLSLRQRILLRERFIADSEEVYAFLHQFLGKGVVPMIINNSRRRGFRNTFRGLLQSVEWVIEKQGEALVAIYDRMPVAEEDPALVPDYTPTQKPIGVKLEEFVSVPEPAKTGETDPSCDPPHFDP
jgi:hypothetical protein